MSYQRGDLYTWVSFWCLPQCPNDCDRKDHEMLHLWIEPENDSLIVLESPEEYNRSAGIGISIERFDELVVMRHAELEAENLLHDAQQRAIEKYEGNVGCFELKKALKDPDDI